MKNKILKATHGSDKTPLQIGTELAIPCYVLEDGTAVLSGRGMQIALGYSPKHSGTELPKLVKNKKFEKFIPESIVNAVENPLRFLRVGSGGSVPDTYGFEATVLIDLCYVLIDAKQAGIKLTKREQILEKQAQVTVRAFSKTGIVAVIYNVTGYQDEVVKGALNVILNKFLLQEAKKYKVTFPLELYRQWFRLNNWEWKKENAQKRPQVIGTWTNNLIYSRMAPGLLDRLKEINPKNERGKLENPYFSFLTDEVGEPKLREFFGGLIALSKATNNWKKYVAMVNKVYPKQGDTLQFDFNDDLDY